MRAHRDSILGLPPALWLILAGAVVLRLAALAILDGPDLVTASESGLTAANWVTGQGYTFDFYGYRSSSPLQSFMPPLFTTIVAACLLTPWPAVLFSGVQIALSTGTVLLIYIIGHRLAGSAAGLTAAALTAVYPPFLVLVDQATVPVLNAFLLALWVWAILCLATTSRRWAVLAGVAGLTVGLNSLSRPSALVLLAVTVLGLRLAPAWAGRRWWRPALIAVAAAGLTVAPWLARNWWIHGRPTWIATNGGFNFWNGNNSFTTGSCFDVRLADLAVYSGEQLDGSSSATIAQVKPYPLPLDLRASVATLDEIALDRALYRAGLGFARQQPGRWAGLLAQKFVSLWWFRPNLGRSSGFYQEGWIAPYQVLYTGVLAAAIGGLALSLRAWRHYVPIYGLLASMTAVYVAYHAITRYRWEMEPLLLMLAAVAIVPAGRAVVIWLRRYARPGGGAS